MTKFCKDCKYLSEDHYHFWCAHPNFGVRVDSGKPEVHRAQLVRFDNSQCGEAATWFVQKPFTRLQRFLQFFQPAPKV